MQLSAKTVSAVASGDYYQVVLDSEERGDDELDPFGQPAPYLMLQRQFEFFDGGKCYVESDVQEYVGHFQLQLIEFTPTRLAFEIARSNHNDHVEICFALKATDFEEALPIVEVIFGRRDPDFETQDVDFARLDPTAPQLRR
jgi:hypothetical protein